MRAIIMAANIAAAIIALLFVVNARLNRRNPELDDYPRKPDGADDVWWTGGRSTWSGFHNLSGDGMAPRGSPAPPLAL
jgi:hypothetical protein